VRSYGEVHVKRQPQRTCLGCRRVLSKRELTRIVRTASGAIAIDATGKLAGRGAYLCSNKACWLAALAQKRIGPALKISLTAEDNAKIEAYAAQLPDQNEQEN
jgi:uncharacterized protein